MTTPEQVSAERPEAALENLPTAWAAIADQLEVEGDMARADAYMSCAGYLAALAAPSVPEDLVSKVADVIHEECFVSTDEDARCERAAARTVRLAYAVRLVAGAAPSVAPPQPVAEIGNASFEVREDEETGRRYWYGAEEGWKGGAEVGDDAGCLVMDPKQFAVGTRITMEEPINEQR